MTEKVECSDAITNNERRNNEGKNEERTKKERRNGEGIAKKQ